MCNELSGLLIMLYSCTDKNNFSNIDPSILPFDYHSIHVHTDSEHTPLYIYIYIY